MNPPLRMLIIEDSEDDSFLTVRALKRDFDVSFERVDTAVAMHGALDGRSWDIVISDYFMPHFDAVAALEILQSKQLDLPFIIVSGKIGEIEAVKAMKAGAHDYIMKEDLTRLVPAIRRELREAEVRRERRQAEKALREQLHFRQALIDSIPAPIYFKNPQGEFIGCNKAYEDFSGLPQDQIIGKTIFDLVPVPQAKSLAVTDDQLLEQQGTQIFESTIAFADGALHDVIFYKATFLDADDSLGGLVGTILDITERKQTEEKLRYMSTHDTLTGLYNRGFFQEEMERLEQGRQFPVSIVVADVDRLKIINDRLGHAAGDELLIRAALVLKGAFRADDIVARIGGDEFAVLLPSADTAVVEEALQRLNNRISMNNCNDDPIRLSMSSGAATAMKGERLEETLKLADRRMYQDKFTKTGESV